MQLELAFWIAGHILFCILFSVIVDEDLMVD